MNNLTHSFRGLAGCLRLMPVLMACVSVALAPAASATPASRPATTSPVTQAQTDSAAPRPRHRSYAYTPSYEVEEYPQSYYIGASPSNYTPIYVMESIYQAYRLCQDNDSIFSADLGALVEGAYNTRFQYKNDSVVFDLLVKTILNFSGRGRQSMCIELINRVMPYYQQEQPHRLCEMTYYLGRLYIMLGAGYEEIGFWRQALNIYRKAMGIIENEVFLRAEPKQSDKLKAMLYNNIATICLKQRDYNQAVDFYTKAIEINTAYGLQTELFNNYNNMAELEISHGDFTKALEYAFLAQRQIDRQDTYSYYFMQCNISQLYFLQGKLEVAWEYMSSGLDYMRENRYDMDYGYGCLYAAALWDAKGDQAKRWNYLQEAERMAKAMGNQTLEVKTYNYIADYYEENGDIRQAYRYLKMGYALNDSIRVLDDAKRLADMELVYEMEKVVQENSLLRKESELKDLNIRRQRLVSILVGIIAVMTIGFISYRLLTQRKRRLAERHLAARREELNRKEMEMMQKRQTDLKNELEIKNRELTSNVLKLVRNNEFIIHLTEELKQLLLELNPRDNAKKEHIRELMTQLRSQSNENSDTEFKYYFEQVYSSFYENLLTAYPSLTPKDLRLCAFLRLGLSTKEISVITFREVRSVESSRNRLRKKMDIPADIDLTEFFSRF
ncbi:MAG: tetratricopeptide repeat protein [Bacteroidales bacterium]|nr:tetratricopeptide repeat protein [Bacteroidales bacterium]